MRKRILRLLAILFLLGLAGFFLFIPSYIDRSKNSVRQKEVPPPPSWYDSIPFIADLHCDELLWDRNFFKQHNYGHIDLPRLQAARMALQVFTIVSKTPRNQNYDHNSGQTDNIGLLSFAQLRPPATWFNITRRALEQCRQLQRNAANSNGHFRLISNLNW